MSDRSHHALPLPDYDHLPLGGLQSRVRSLTAGEVEELLAYEHSHGDRLPVTELLDGLSLEQWRARALAAEAELAALKDQVAGTPGM